MIYDYIWTGITSPVFEIWVFGEYFWGGIRELADIKTNYEVRNSNIKKFNF